MFNSADRTKQLRQNLRAIQVFMIFGSFFILFIWVCEIFFERKEALSSHHSTIIGARVVFYALLLPFLLYYYMYNPIRDIFKIDRFLVDVDCDASKCKGMLLNNKNVFVSKPDTKEEIIIIFGTKYLCKVYHENSNSYYFPLEKIKRSSV